MKVIQPSDGLSQVKVGCVLTMGNFDGVHVGHQEILATADKLARQRNTQVVVMTFEPHPVAVLFPEKAPGVLTPLVAKLRLLRECADDCVIVLEDNRELLAMTPSQFVDEILMDTIRPSVVVEGDDFHFGAGRSGDVDTLRRLGTERGFDVVVVAAKNIQLGTGQAIRASSTMIRYMLESSHVADAAAILSRPYRLIGQIVPGRGRGKELGYPTLNMAKPDQILPAEGVYAGTVELADSVESLLDARDRFPAVFSLGQARTFGDQHPLLIEAHVLDRSLGDRPGKWMAMDFVEHLRSQHKFASPEQLVKHIQQDCRRAKSILARR